MSSPESKLISLLRTHLQPSSPILPDIPDSFRERQNRPLPRTPRAVLFDIYGTLFVSLSGDIGTATHDHSEAKFDRAISMVTGKVTDPNIGVVACRRYHDEIRTTHARLRADGVRYPEVDIMVVWESVAKALHTVGFDVQTNDLPRIALCYEIISNPVWPMPAAEHTMRTIHRSGMELGVVSNAQFYTSLLFPALLGASMIDFGFCPNAVSLSYEHGIAKPDVALFRKPLAHLKNAGIDSSRVVYIGNDMLNDIYCAHTAGCMTVLFAGDRRSLRLRSEHTEVRDLHPDSVVQNLPSLLPVLGLQRKGCS